MAGTPRTFSRRGHSEAKVREDIGQGEPREDLTEKASKANRQQSLRSPRVLLTRSPSRFLGVLRLLPRLRLTRFRGCGLRDSRTRREGVLSLKHRRCNETKEYHRAQQSPHENDWLPGNQNVHGRPPGTKSGLRLPLLYGEEPQTYFVKILLVRDCRRGCLLEILSKVAGLAGLEFPEGLANKPVAGCRNCH
jgi:hypothetical protein